MDVDPRRNQALGVLGNALSRRDCDSFSLAQLRPTVPEHEVHAHAHDDMHVVLLLSGLYVSDAVGMPAVCTEPALILNPPGTEHRDRFRSRDGLFVTLTMPRANFEGLGDGVAGMDRPVRLTPASLTLATRWLRELGSWEDSSPLAVESTLSELLETASASRAAAGKARAGLRRAVARLDEESDTAPRLAELAQLAGLHPVYFARSFRLHFGASPGEYLRRRRVHRAIPMIIGGRSLAQSAALLGFVDESHLHHSFVREMGLTPGAFRRLALARREVSRIQDRLLRG